MIDPPTSVLANAVLVHDGVTTVFKNSVGLIAIPNAFVYHEQSRGTKNHAWPT